MVIQIGLEYTEIQVSCNPIMQFKFFDPSVALACNKIVEEHNSQLALEAGEDELLGYAGPNLQPAEMHNPQLLPQALIDNPIQTNLGQMIALAMAEVQELLQAVEPEFMETETQLELEESPTEIEENERCLFRKSRDNRVIDYFSRAMEKRNI